jgi:hypothetical protein
MDRVSFILPKVLRQRGLGDEAVASVLTAEAKNWIAKKLPAHTTDLQPTKFEQGVLFIEARNSIALAECEAQKADLQRFLQDLPWNASISSIRLLRAR